MLGITRGWIVAGLRDIYEQPKAESKLGPANRALEILARLCGDMIEQTETELRGLYLVINGVDAGDLA